MKQPNLRIWLSRQVFRNEALYAARLWGGGLVGFRGWGLDGRCRTRAVGSIGERDVKVLENLMIEDIVGFLDARKFW